MTFDQFIEAHTNHFLEYNNDQYKFQCMDLFWVYLKEVLAIDPRPYQGWGTAKNCYNNTQNIKGFSSHFTLVQNTPTNIPHNGDIVFWKTYPFVTGLAGHVAIFKEGGVYSFLSFDQNYPTNSPCHLQPHSYRGVIGWFSPKKV